MKTILSAVSVVLFVTLAAWAQVPPKAYLLIQVDITNPQRYGEYAKLTPGLIDKFGGRFVARGGRSATLEGPGARSRVVVIEFPSFERAQQFYNSPEYQAAKKVRDGAAHAQIVLVEGL